MSEADRKHPREWPFDPERILEAWVLHWQWILCAALGAALLGFTWGLATVRHTATLELVYERPPQAGQTNAGESASSYGQVSLPMLVELARSDLVWGTNGLWQARNRVHSQAELVPGPGFLRLVYHGRSREDTASTLNQWAGQLESACRQWQHQGKTRYCELLDSAMAKLEGPLARVESELSRFLREEGLVDFDQETSAWIQQRVELETRTENLRIQVEAADLRIRSLLEEITRQSPALVAAKEALNQALTRYTEKHPRVKELRAAVAAIETQLARDGARLGPEATARGNPLLSSLYSQVVELRTQKTAQEKQLAGARTLQEQLRDRLLGLPDKQRRHAELKARHQELRARRELLAARQREARLALEANVSQLHPLSPAAPEKISRLPVFFGVLGRASAAGLAAAWLAALVLALREMLDRRIRTERDLRRATGLPVLARLGDLEGMSQEQRERWAFSTVRILLGRLGAGHRQTLLCGFTSAGRWEGRSTWIRLLVEAAQKQGFQTCGITVGAPESGPQYTAAPAVDGPPELPPMAGPWDLEKAALSAAVTPTLHLPLPRWIWSAEGRDQWSGILTRWQGMDRTVVLVELPPAAEPEAILLAESLPHVIWLCARDMAGQSESRALLETLRQSRINLAGAVFNRATGGSWKNLFKLGAQMLLGLACLLASRPLAAQTAPEAATNAVPPNAASPAAAETNAVPFQTNRLYQVGVSPTKLAGWQQKFTLGPGDVLDIGIYDQADTARSGLVVGPDGRINYLQARDVEVTGLSVDELRERLEQILGKFYLAPRVVVNPQGYHSKKYYVLGSVVGKGVYPLDRPTTILEAIARAKGFEILAQQRESLLLADLSRSFLVRQGLNEESARVPVDFEALFLRGDLTHNLALAPDDFLYFSPLEMQEVFVLGEVKAPGVVPFARELSAMGAVVGRGGFTDRAWRQKVLIIRGSLNQPETFAVDMTRILSAKTPDFQLKPRDIVYVARKPWAKTVEVLQAGLMAYTRAVLITWTGKNVGPFTQEPYLK